MSTVIDEFVVQIGLDPSKFTKGQQEALASFKRTQEATIRGGKEIEAQGARTTQSLSGLKSQALGLFAAFTGGAGLQQFVNHLTTSDATVGRLSRNIGASTATITKWQGAARLTGGTAEGLAGTFQSLSDAFAGWKIGIMTPIIGELRAVQAAGGKTIEVNKGVEQSLLDLSANLKTIHDQDPSRAGLLGRRLNLDPAFYDLLIKGPAATKEILDYVNKIGTATKANADAAGELQTRWNNLLLRSESIGRSVMTWITPAIGATADWLNKSPRDAVRQLLLQIPGARDLEPGNAPTPLGPHPASPLNVKPGAGEMSLAVRALARQLQSEVPGLDRFTSFNDSYHAFLGRSSAHQRGEALDFTIKDAAQSAAVAAAVRKKLADMGIPATVIDEYSNPSRGSTGGHIHVGFANGGAAQRYSDLKGMGASVGAANINNARTTSSQTSIGTMIVNSGASDAAGIAADIKAAIERQSLSANANFGAN